MKNLQLSKEIGYSKSTLDSLVFEIETLEASVKAKDSKIEELLDTIDSLKEKIKEILEYL